MQDNINNQNQIDQSLALSDNAHDRDFVQSLQRASEGLLWFSEGEYPFQVVYWHDVENLKTSENSDQSVIFARESIPTETKTVIQELVDFFIPASLEQPWHNEAEKVEVRRYQVLSELLTKNLQNLQVYLVGDIEIDVYILGRTENQAIAGLKTKTIAT